LLRDLFFSGLRFFNEREISGSGPPALSPSQRTCAQDFYILKKSIHLSRIWICKPWISRRALYPEIDSVWSTRWWQFNFWNFHFGEFAWNIVLSALWG